MSTAGPIPKNDQPYRKKLEYEGLLGFVPKFESVTNGENGEKLEEVLNGENGEKEPLLKKEEASKYGSQQ